MLFVFMSHFLDVYALSYLQWKPVRVALHTVAMVATPTFVLLSGLSLGYLYRSKKDDFDRVRERLLDRGLFFIVVGHPLISLAYCNIHGTLARSFMAVHITDSVGLCIMAGPYLIQHLKPYYRVAGGLLLYLACWAGIIWWHPSGAVLSVWKEVLLGVVPEPFTLWYTFPLLTWFGLYVACTAAGERVYALAQEPDQRNLEAFVVKAATAALVVSALSILAKRYAEVRGGIAPGLSGCVSIYQKTPPGPVYFLFFGGMGLLMLTFFLLYKELPLLKPYMFLAEILGKVSFFAFVLQYFVFELLLYSLKVPYSVFWPLLLLVCSGFIFVLAKIWHENGYNRFISLKYFLRF